MLPPEQALRIQDQPVQKHELAIDLGVEERHLGLIRRRIDHTSGSGHEVAGGSPLIRSDQRRRRKTPTRRRRDVAVGRVLPSQHLLLLLTDPGLLQVAVAVAVRPEARQGPPVRGHLVEAGLGGVDDPPEQLRVGRRFVLEQAEADEVSADAVALVLERFPDLLQVEFSLTKDGLAGLVHEVERDPGLITFRRGWFLI